MLPKSESIKLLRKHFKKNKIATMPELLGLLETTARMSVFRRLSDLAYISSYSHKGKYYTLPSVTLFNNEGLYHTDTTVSFSQYGNLKKTIIKLVESSTSGHTHRELETLLKLEVHDSLLLLTNAKQLSRQKLDGYYVYFSVSKTHAKQQLTQRQSIGGLLKSHREIPKLLIIEVLVAIIRTNQMNIDAVAIISDLKARKIVITENEIEQILLQLHLKKTLD